MSNVPTVQKIYQLFSKGDYHAILELVSEKISWEHEAVDHGIPWLRPGRGKLHVLEFFKQIAREFEITKFDVKNPIDYGKQVITMVEIEAKVGPKKKPLRDTEVHLWYFDDEGKLKTFRHLCDTHQHFLLWKR